MSENMTVRLPDRTRKKVVEAAERVGYRPNRLAQAMKAGKTELVGVWIPLDRPVLNYLKALQEINSCAHKDGYDLMITGLDAKMAFAGKGRAPFSWPIDGLIGYDAGKAAAHFRADKRNDSIPLVVIGLEQYVNSDSIAWQLCESYKAVVELLLARGLRKIVHVTPEWVFREYPREQRRRGYCEAMVEAGLDPILVCAPDETSQGARTAMAELLDSGYRPEAVMAFTDAIAIGAAGVLIEKGVSVPGDCVVWGCGDFPEAEYFRVPISTVRIPVKQVVNRAWEMLMGRIKDPTIEGRLEVLPMEIVERESSGT